MAFAKSLAINSLCSNLHSTSPYNKQTSLFHSLSFNNLYLYNALYGQLRLMELAKVKPPRPNIQFSSMASENQVLVKEDKMKELVRRVRERLESFTAVDYNHETLVFIDLIERLGIARFFDEQITRIIEIIFMQWDKKFGLGNAESTVLAFRLLRLHGYPVDTCVLGNLRDGKGEFSSFSIDSAPKISAMLNFHRCWQVCFHTEPEIVEEIRKFTTSQLNLALLKGNPSLLQPNNLKSEIMFALEYPRRYLVQRIESRRIIRQLWPSSGYMRMSLELAKLDLAMLQTVHKREISTLHKWWEESGIPTTVPWTRSWVHQSYFAMSSVIYEPEFVAFRLAFTKITCLVALVDLIFDLPFLDSDHHAPFTNAFLRWDESAGDDLPGEHRIILKFAQRTIVELAAETSQAQGRDLLPFIKSCWDDTVTANLKEAQWRNARHRPSWDEYVAVATLTIAGVTMMWTTVHSMGEQLSDEVFRLVGPGSRLMELVALIGRLSNDLVTFQREARDGEVASLVSAYMVKHPDCKTEDEAVACLQKMGDSWCHELEWEIFEAHKVVPECLSRALLGYARSAAFCYKRADAYSAAWCDSVYEDLVNDYMSGSIEV